jgi:4-hydroxybenzoate polyprenyltransferase
MSENANDLRTRTKASIELLRPGWWLACFFIGLTPGLLALWSIDSVHEFFQFNTVIWAFGYWASIVGVYSLNDVAGIEEDKIVNPKRPLPSGRVTKKGAIGLGVTMILLGVMAWWIAFYNIYSTLIQLSAIGLMIVHPTVFKDNFLLSLAAALIPIGVWIALAPFHPIAIALFLIIFFWEATMDVPENLMHLEGDKKVHPQTWAIRFGPKRFAKFGIYFAVITVACMMWLFILIGLSPVFLIFAVLSGLFLIMSQLSIRNDQSPMKMGQSIGMTMLSIFLVNIGLISHSLMYTYIW